MELASGNYNTRSILRLGGKRRASTLRQRIRTWRPIRKGLLEWWGSPWPRKLSELTDFMEARLEEGVSRSWPSSVLAALSTLEKCGGAREPMSASSTLLNFVDDIVVSRGPGDPTRKAPEFFVTMLLSMELFMFGDEDNYSKMICFTRLLKIWTSMRHDDTLGLSPSICRTTGQGWTALLSRMKTTGPGKGMVWLPIFIGKGTTLSGRDWLA